MVNLFKDETERKLFLSGLKVGDEVLINSNYRDKNNYETDTIVKITPTGIIKTKNKYVFGKDGYQHAKDSWSSTLSIVNLNDYDDKRNYENSKSILTLSKIGFSLSESIKSKNKSLTIEKRLELIDKINEINNHFFK